MTQSPRLGRRQERGGRAARSVRRWRAPTPHAGKSRAARTLALPRATTGDSWRPPSGAANPNRVIRLSRITGTKVAAVNRGARFPVLVRRRAPYGARQRPTGLAFPPVRSLFSLADSEGVASGISRRAAVAGAGCRRVNAAPSTAAVWLSYETRPLPADPLQRYRADDSARLRQLRRGHAIAAPLAAPRRRKRDAWRRD
jgi:hypothetical protein